MKMLDCLLGVMRLLYSIDVEIATHTILPNEALDHQQKLDLNGLVMKLMRPACELLTPASRAPI